MLIIVPMQRELEEEAGITARDLVKRGILLFQFMGDPMPMEVHVFCATQFDGVVKESEEMKPQWFDVADVPFDDMWKVRASLDEREKKSWGKRLMM